MRRAAVSSDRQRELGAPASRGDSAIRHRVATGIRAAGRACRASTTEDRGLPRCRPAGALPSMGFPCLDPYPAPCTTTSIPTTPSVRCGWAVPAGRVRRRRRTAWPSHTWRLPLRRCRRRPTNPWRRTRPRSARCCRSPRCSRRRGSTRPRRDGPEDRLHRHQLREAAHPGGPARLLPAAGPEHYAVRNRLVDFLVGRAAAPAPTFPPRCDRASTTCLRPRRVATPPDALSFSRMPLQRVV